MPAVAAFRVTVAETCWLEASVTLLVLKDAKTPREEDMDRSIVPENPPRLVIVTSDVA